MEARVLEEGLRHRVRLELRRRLLGGDELAHVVADVRAVGAQLRLEAAPRDLLDDRRDAAAVGARRLHLEGGAHRLDRLRPLEALLVVVEAERHRRERRRQLQLAPLDLDAHRRVLEVEEVDDRRRLAVGVQRDERVAQAAVQPLGGDLVDAAAGMAAVEAEVRGGEYAMGGAEWDGGAPFDRALDVRPRVERLVAVDVRLVAEHRLVPPLAGERVEAVRLRRELVPQHRLQLLERRRLLLLRLLPLGGEQPLVDRRLPREALRRALELEPRGARRRVDREHLVLGERDRLRARVGRGAAQRAQSEGARLPWAPTARPRLRDDLGRAAPRSRPAAPRARRRPPGRPRGRASGWAGRALGAALAERSVGSAVAGAPRPSRVPSPPWARPCGRTGRRRAAR